MLSHIACLVNYDNEEIITIWSPEFILSVISSHKQLVWILWLTHTEQQREDMLDMSQEELIHILLATKHQNQIKVLYPN